MSSGEESNTETLADGVQKYLRLSGYTLRDLAGELNFNYKVLSRKLNGSSNAVLSRLDLKRIILTLARWKGITRRNEVFYLLELAQAGPNIFTADEWQKPPLNDLTDEPAEPTLSTPFVIPNISTPPIPQTIPGQITPLIGRQRAIEHVRNLLLREDVRLVTLVGAGGSGKTRLAQHVAHVLLDKFADGAWFVALAGVRDPEQLPMSIISALNIRSAADASSMQSLTTYLRGKQLLLVLDNFEQIVTGATMLSDLLVAAPGLKIVVTSRIVLRLNGEREFRVPPLDLPDVGMALELDRLMRYSAIQLFIERAQAVDPDFTLTAENAAFIAQICARLDGLPLALELAAARIKVLGPAQLLEKLSKKMLPVLIGGARDLPDRQQTMHNTIIWSYELLSPSEKMWFCRLGIFNGGWSLEATEALMRVIPAEHGYTLTPLSALTMLEQLVNNCLLVRHSIEHGQVRFTMLETLREYAIEQLTEQKEIERLRDWHASYYLKLAEAGEIGLRGPQQLEWLKRLTIERDNFQAALEWSLQRARAGKNISTLSSANFRSSGEGKETAASKRGVPGVSQAMEMFALELCLRLAAALRPFWEWRGYLDESRSELKAALEISERDIQQKSVLAARAKALSEMTRLASLQNDQPGAVELAEESIALWRQLDDPRGLATALFHRGWPAFGMAEYEVAQQVFTQGLQLLSPTDDGWWRGQFLFYLGSVAGFFSSDFEQMRLLHAQSVELFEQAGDQSAIADLLKDQGGLMILEGKYSQSIESLLKSIKISHELGHKQFITTALGWLGFAAGLRELPDPTSASLQAAQLWGAAEGRQSNTGFTPWIKNIDFIQQVMLFIKSRVDEESWNAAYNAGKDMSEEQAIEFARSL